MRKRLETIKVPKISREACRNFYNHKEKNYGAILGPLKNNPFSCSITILPLNTVPKKGSEERRIILDLSYPSGPSINDNVP